MKSSHCNCNFLIRLPCKSILRWHPDKRLHRNESISQIRFRFRLSLCNVMELSVLSFHATRPPLFKRQKKRNRRRDKRRHVLYPSGSIAEKKPHTHTHIQAHIGRKMSLRHRPVCGPPVSCFRTHYGVHQLTDKWRKMVKNGRSTTTTW